MARKLSPLPVTSSGKSRPMNADTASRAAISRVSLSLLAVGLFALCGLPGHSQTTTPYVPPVVVSSVSPVHVPVPPLPPGHTTYGTQSGDLTPLYSPTSLALDACGNIYTLDKGSDTGATPGSTGDTVTEIPANGGYASIVENLGGYVEVPLGQDPTHKNLLVGHQYSGSQSLGLVPITNCVPDASKEVRTGGGTGPLFYYYNIISSGADFAENYYISTDQTCCVANSYYLIQESGGNGNILLTNPSTPSFNPQDAYNDLTIDRNQNIYYIEPSIPGVVSELAYSGGPSGSYATAPIQFGPTYINPVGLSVDANSNLYIVDEANYNHSAVYGIPFESNGVGGGALNPAHQLTLISGLTPGPAFPVAVDAEGDLYYATNTQFVMTTPPYAAFPTSVYKLSFGGANFGTVKLKQTVSRSINFQFNGPTTVASIKLPAGAFATKPTDKGTAPCTAGVTYAPASYYQSDYCVVVVTFTPTTDGSQSSTVVLEDANGSPVATAYVEGAGEGAVPPIATTTALTASPNGDLTPGQPYTLTATVSPVSGSTVPTGTLVFTIGGVGSIQLQLVNGTAVFSGVANQPGTYTVFANYNGGPGFAGSRSAFLTRTVTP